MSATERPTLEVGRIVRAHGLRGQVIVHLWSDRLERLAPGSELRSERGHLVVTASAPHGEGHLVSFDGVGTREAAESLRGLVLYAERIEDDSVIWIDDLFGARVVDAEGIERGVVTGVEANPASDLLVLDTGHLVPLTFVTRVLANELIEVEAPEGLFS